MCMKEKIEKIVEWMKVRKKRGSEWERRWLRKKMYNISNFFLSPSQNKPSSVSDMTSISLYGIGGIFVFLCNILQFRFEQGERNGSSMISSLLLALELLGSGHKLSRYLKKAEGVDWGTIWKLIFNRNLLSKSINCSFLKWGKFDWQRKEKKNGGRNRLQKGKWKD